MFINFIAIIFVYSSNFHRILTVTLRGGWSRLSVMMTLTVGNMIPLLPKPVNDDNITCYATVIGSYFGQIDQGVHY